MDYCFPTGLHKKVAERLTSFFSTIDETEAVLLTCSCARGMATKDSCLDIAVLFKSEHGFVVSRNSSMPGKPNITIMRCIKSYGVSEGIHISLLSLSMVHLKRASIAGLVARMILSLKLEILSFVQFRCFNGVLIL